MIRAACTVAIALSFGGVIRADEALSIGSPAPELKLSTFLLGEPLNELKHGTIYVIEFSGTQCPPCVRCIPHLTDLQKKHKETVFFSVYSENRKNVSDFLNQHRDKIGYRVAVDPDRAVWNAWMRKASQEGIPTVFVIDAKGLIAWIGTPDDMADPLAGIVAGTFDPGVDKMRLRFEKRLSAGREQLDKREERAWVNYGQATALIAIGKLTEALAIVEAGLRECEDIPNGVYPLKGAKLQILARQPSTKEAAIEFAVEWAVATKFARDEFRWVQVISSLLKAASPPESRDLRLIDLAMAMLRDLEKSLEQKSDNSTIKNANVLRIQSQELLSRAYHLRGETESLSGKTILMQLYI
ncbi:TlpA family protein disulfide reductase [Fimbriiglobus ruber]|uniref:TlpA family protein disulfide reductase n=1 Tax=Fimbriiglobus ruber TaxID=1908690 RepID=UPI00137A9F86|nr:TlpA disulfide reductase family protein [Fimbriiglobus ruber]